MKPVLNIQHERNPVHQYCPFADKGPEGICFFVDVQVVRTPGGWSAFTPGDSSTKALQEVFVNIRDERRKYRRFKVDANVLACCRRHSPKVAEVIDVSQAGMAFTYVGRGCSSSDCIELDIVFPDGTDYVDRVPCEPISDVDMGAGVRRSGARFIKLTKDQGAKLDFFMENYCVQDNNP
jgi:hypothetical protein